MKANQYYVVRKWDSLRYAGLQDRVGSFSRAEDWNTTGTKLPANSSVLYIARLFPNVYAIVEAIN